MSRLYDDEVQHLLQRATLERQQMQDSLKTGVLFALALYFLYVALSGNSAYYINERLSWLVWLAAALFALLGAGSAFGLLSRREQTNAIALMSGGEHTRITWSGLAIVAVPLLLGTLLPAQPLDANAVGGSISTSAVTAGTASTIERDPASWTVLDWLRSFNSSLDLSEFNGRQATLIGFVYKEPTFAEDTFMLARFTVSCCVADASAIGVPVVWADAAQIEQSTWLRVEGAFQLGAFRGDDVPLLQASSVEVVPQPEHPYLYP